MKEDFWFRHLFETIHLFETFPPANLMRQTLGVSHMLVTQVHRALPDSVATSTAMSSAVQQPHIERFACRRAKSACTSDERLGMREMPAPPLATSAGIHWEPWRVYSSQGQDKLYRQYTQSKRREGA